MGSDETAVLLNISDMIDLAIGTPEVGVVDFNMLQTVLHCLAQQLRVLGKTVELRGSMSALPTIRENQQTIAIKEYVVESDAKKDAKKKDDDVEETILIVERVKKSESMIKGTSTDREVSPAPQTTAAGVQHGPEKLSIVTISKFNLLEKAVDDLKSRVYGSIPKNEDMIQEVRSQTNIKAITDMWTNLNVSSRLEAAENGINKLSSLVQDVVGETNATTNNIKSLETWVSQIPGAPPPPPPQPRPASAPIAPLVGPGAAGAAGAPGQAGAGQAGAVGAAGQAGRPGAPGQAPQIDFTGLASKEDLMGVFDQLMQMQTDMDQLSNTFYDAMTELQTQLTQAVPSVQLTTTLQPLTPRSAAAATAAGAGAAGQPSGKGLTMTDQFKQMKGDLIDKIIDFEKRLNVCCETIKKVEGVTHDQLSSFQDQLENLLKQVSGGSPGLTESKLSPDLVKDLQGLMELFQVVQEMQGQLKQIQDTALQLASEKDERTHNMDSLLEQIELLKNIKMDREDMIEAMAEKADMGMLARKVSHDQFIQACDDLAKGLDTAVGKLNLQEALWQQALDDIQREIETKLDKMELSPVKDFFNNKLKQLQEHLKQISNLRREAEAAGTKKRLLRDVTCLSCDANAVMNMDPTPVQPAKPLPAHLSMKPYLSYELDAIRKTQASSVPQRNMHDWENIEKQSKSAPAGPKTKPDKHICNRYCGGSHTVTTAAQRVARLGHFIKQWGPDVLPLSSGLAAGDDGRMYKVSTAENVKSGQGGAADPASTPKSPNKRASDTSSQKGGKIPTAVTPDCRCLEEGQKK